MDPMGKQLPISQRPVILIKDDPPMHLTPVLDAAFMRAHQLIRSATSVTLARHQVQSIGAGVTSGSRESCGVLLGRCANARIIVERVIRTRNFSRRSGSFMLSLGSIAKAIGRNPSEAFLGVFHSHVDSAVPSRADVRGMSASRCLWLIAGRQRLGAYRVIDHTLESIPVEGG
jgi:proteasome lid subunit RPN8/RPN11